MAVPARHTSKAKKNKRRTHYKLTAPSVKFDETTGVLRLFFEVRYKRSPDSLCTSVMFTRMVSPFYYSAEAAFPILRPL